MKQEVIIREWPNGNTKHEWPKLNGQYHGLNKYWIENGGILAEVTYKNNFVNGIKITFRY